MSGWASPGRLDLGDHLGVGVVARIVGREVGGGRRRGGRERGSARDDEEQGQAEGQARTAVVHARHHGRAARPRYPAMGLRRTGTDRPREHRGPLRSLKAQRTGPHRTRRTTGVSTMDRSIRRAGAALGAALLVIALTAAPAFACGGLIGPNGAVNLLRTTTLAGYHDGEEHYITAFQFAGGGGAFGSLTPLPGIPSSVEKGGDWTLQRLIRETEPQPAFAARRCALRAAAGSAEELMKVRIDALDVTVLRGGSAAVGRGRPSTASGCRPMRPRCSTSTPRARRSSWPPCSTPMPPPNAARRSVTGRRSTSRSRPTTRGSRCASWPSARPRPSGSRPTSTC